MSSLDILKKAGRITFKCAKAVGSAIWEGYQNYTQQTSAYKERYSKYDDMEIYKKMKDSSSITEIAACQSLLEERGYKNHED